MSLKQEGPAMAGGQCLGLQSHSPAPGEHQRDRSRVAAPRSHRCDRVARADGTLGHPSSLSGTPSMLATESL